MLRDLWQDTIRAAVADALTPIDKRLVRVETKLETMCSARSRRRDTFWRVLVLATTLPACVYAALRLFMM